MAEVLDAMALGVLGLLVGSFLNVVVHRLPKMMELRWAAECADLQGHASVDLPSAEAPQRFNLMVPRSRCPHCGHQIRWFENIPVLSYIGLRGQCTSCRARISPRYPLIELLNAVPLCLVWLALGAELDRPGLEWFCCGRPGSGLHRLGHHVVTG